MRILENSSWLLLVVDGVSSSLSFVESIWSCRQLIFDERLIRWNVINNGKDLCSEQIWFIYWNDWIGQVTE